jgi:hypothetical protein
MVLLSLIPQLHLWLVRGRDWNGAYVSLQGDEPLYSAYINSLIDGRARRNDPYAAKDNSPASPVPESTFSIQFLPAYVIAGLARLTGVTASTAFIALVGVSALFASIALFTLLNALTGDPRVAAAGTLFVLCLGGLAGGHGLVGLLLKTDLSLPGLPFLRRYQPAAAFPCFFVFNVLVWQALTRKPSRRPAVSALLAGLVLASLIFSYLYLWTSAAAWLLCVASLWLYFQRAERRKSLATLATISALAAMASVPYVYLLSHRPPSLDEQQTLVTTRQLDLFRPPELLGVLVLVFIAFAIRYGKTRGREPLAIFAASYALLPLVVFNQQLISGRTMQSYHFAAFIVNYSVLVSLTLCATLFRNVVPARLLVWVAALSFSWGVIEVGLPSRLNFVPAAVLDDQAVPVLRRLRELAKEDGTRADLRGQGHATAMVFSPRLGVSVMQPTWTSQGTLLDIGGLDFGSVTREERREYFYQHLYYSQAAIDSLRKALSGAPEDPAMNYYARAVIFGHDRIVPALSGHFRPIQPQEIEQAVRAYQTYADSFAHEQAQKRPVTYAIIPAAGNFDFTNLDRWYERDSGEAVGAYVLYRLKLRSQEVNGGRN